MSHTHTHMHTHTHTIHLVAVCMFAVKLSQHIFSMLSAISAAAAIAARAGEREHSPPDSQASL